MGVVERLRLAGRPAEWCDGWGLTVVRCSLVVEAADEIERLRGVIARYVAADEDLRGPVVVGGWRKFSWGDREFYEARDGLWVEAKGDAGV